MFIGNQKIVKFLKHSLKKKVVSQAYLFCGPEAVGKFLLAKIFSQAVIYEKDFSDMLLNVDKNENTDYMPDIIIVQPQIEEKKGVFKEKEISVGQIRDALGILLTYPLLGKFKVLIVNEAHKMNESAQNSILKTLEEPNGTSLIILVSHNEEEILPTLKSRCQKIVFSLTGEEEIGKMFWRNKKTSTQDAVVLSMGRAGIASELGKDKKNILELKKNMELLRKIENLDINERLKIAEKLSKNIPKTSEILKFWIWTLRHQVVCQDKNAFTNFEVIEKIENSLFEISKRGASNRLILENLLINIFS